mgnify:CR=1 FL=1
MDKKSHPIDTYFREALKDHRVEPPGSGREAFLKEAGKTGRAEKKRNLWVLGMSVVLLILSAGILVYITGDHQPDAERRQSITEPAAVTAEGSMSQAPAPGKTSGTTAQQVSGPTSPCQPVPLRQTTTCAPVMMPSNPGAIPYSGEEVMEIAENPGIPAPVRSSSFISPLVRITFQDFPYSGHAREIIPLETLSEKKEKKVTLRNESGYQAGFYVMPEVMFNTLEEEKFAWNLGAEGSYYFRDFSITTGVGLSLTKGTRELMVEYNDYLGTYSNLDSISFYWNENHTQVIPTYYMTDKDVWDSLMKLDYPKVIKRYLYLQVPLMLGYDFWKNERCSFGVRVGPVLSVMMDSKRLSDDYDPGKNRVIAVNNITPDRISLNWQIAGGLNFSYLPDGRWSLDLEPEARYYFNSVYEKSEIRKKPWSIGLKAVISLDIKK